MNKKLACAAIIIVIEGDTVKVKRKGQGFSHETLLKELMMSSPEDYKIFLRIDNETFSGLLGLVTPYIIKQDTNMSYKIDASDFLMKYRSLYIKQSVCPLLHVYSDPPPSYIL